MELPQNAPFAQIEGHLRRQLAENGSVHVSADALAEAICARCHEEVRVWAENFARAHDALAEEDPAHAHFSFHRKRFSPSAENGPPRN